MPTSQLARSSALGVLFLSLSSLAFAQLDTGTIVGTVIDTSAAVLPGVTITATQEGTGVAADHGDERERRSTRFPACASAATPSPPSCRASGAASAPMSR